MKCLKSYLEFAAHEACTKFRGCKFISKGGWVWKQERETSKPGDMRGHPHSPSYTTSSISPTTTSHQTNLASDFCPAFQSLSPPPSLSSHHSPVQKPVTIWCKLSHKTSSEWESPAHISHVIPSVFFFFLFFFLMTLPLQEPHLLKAKPLAEACREQRRQNRLDTAVWEIRYNASLFPSSRWLYW